PQAAQVPFLAAQRRTGTASWNNGHDADVQTLGDVALGPLYLHICRNDMTSPLSRLHDVLNRLSLSRSPRRRGQAARPSYRPRFECLEERCLLAVDTVTLLSDTTANSSPGELRTTIA